MARRSAGRSPAFGGGFGFGVNALACPLTQTLGFGVRPAGWVADRLKRSCWNGATPALPIGRQTRRLEPLPDPVFRARTNPLRTSGLS